jgi:acetyl-CoA C-acetyltransferase
MTAGFFNDLMTPFKGVAKDNNLRADLSIEKLRSLKPCFDKKVRPEPGHADPRQLHAADRRCIGRAAGQ